MSEYENNQQVQQMPQQIGLQGYPGGSNAICAEMKPMSREILVHRFLNCKLIK